MCLNFTSLYFDSFILHPSPSSPPSPGPRKKRRKHLKVQRAEGGPLVIQRVILVRKWKSLLHERSVTWFNISLREGSFSVLFFFSENTGEMDEQYKGRILGWEKTVKSMVPGEGPFQLVRVVTRGEHSSVRGFAFAWAGSAELQGDLKKYENWSDEILRICSFLDTQKMNSATCLLKHPAFGWVQNNLDVLIQIAESKDPSGLPSRNEAVRLTNNLYDLFYAVLRK